MTTILLIILEEHFLSFAQYLACTHTYKQKTNTAKPLTKDERRVSRLLLSSTDPVSQRYNKTNYQKMREGFLDSCSQRQIQCHWQAESKWKGFVEAHNQMMDFVLAEKKERKQEVPSNHNQQSDALFTKHIISCLKGPWCTSFHVWRGLDAHHFMSEGDLMHIISCLNGTWCTSFV